MIINPNVLDELSLEWKEQNMSVPRFTAEQSLMSPSSHFRAEAVSVQSTGDLQPMVSQGYYQYLASLICTVGCVGLDVGSQCVAQCPPGDWGCLGTCATTRAPASAHSCLRTCF